MSDPVPLGTLVTFTGTFKNAAGVLTNPTVVTLTIEAPDGTVTAYTTLQLTNPSVGAWTKALNLNQSGDWLYRFDGDGAVDAQNEGVVTVERSLFEDDGEAAATYNLVCAPWGNLDDFNRLCDPVVDASEAQVLAKLGESSDLLYLLTSRRWPGACEDSVRPCGVGTFAGWGYSVPAAFRPRPGSVPISGWCGCNRPRSCGCRRLSEIKLPGRLPIVVSEVKVDGAVVPADRYRVDDGRWLVLLPQEGDDLQGWPCCQDLALPDTEEDTFSITFTAGSGPPAGGVSAACSLARELLLACSSTAGECRLPDRVQRITRQGIAIDLDLFEEGRTGLREVDLWVTTVLMGDKRRGAAVLVPGRSRRFRRTGA